MLVSNNNITIDLDLTNGNTIGLYNPNDPFKMNWILKNSRWGVLGDFEITEIKEMPKGVYVAWENNKEQLKLSVKKVLLDDKYQECYCLTNMSNNSVYLNKDSFGLNFPYACVFQRGQIKLEESCVTHVWCGGDVAWMYSAKPSGSKPYLVCYCSSGSFSDYSLNYDVSRSPRGCDYRGDIVLHLTECEVASGERVEFVLNYMFSDESPDTATVGLFGDMRLSADKYSVFVNEEINCRFESVYDLSDLEILCEGECIKYEIEDNVAVWKISSETSKEIKVCARLKGKKTWMYLNVIEPLDVILHKRAKYITEKQQFHEEANQLDGAYLIYDRVEGKLICDSSFHDHNSARERLALGTVVAVALQYKFDSFMMESLKKHREFIEREIFDEENSIVCDDVGYNNVRSRAYNYPWMADYYLEWYNLTKEQRCIINAAKIIISYYDKANGIVQVSPCMRITDMCDCLEKEGLYELKQNVLDRICAHADLIIEQGEFCFSEEVSCTQGMFIGKIELLCQTYLLTQEEKYLSLIPFFLEKSNSFCAQQPDFHLNDIAVRYWDLYWFGKLKIYGDTMPQWLSAWAGVVYSFLYKCGFGIEFKKRSENILKSGLCLFDNKGFGSTAYLMPYKVTQYSSDSKYHGIHMTEKVAYGHKYDDYANDQDWALYFAIKEL